MMLIILFLYIFITSLLSFILFDCYFDKRGSISWKKQFIMLFIITFLEALIKNQFNHSGINLLLTAITTFLICFIFFKGKPEVQILVSFLVLFINMMLDVLSILPVNTLFKLDMEVSGIEPLVIVSTALPFCLAKLMLVHFVRRKRKKTANMGDKYSYYLQMVIPAGSIIYSIYYTTSIINQPYFQLFQCYITLFFLIGVNIVHYIIFENKERLYLKNYNNLLLQQKYEHREEYYKNLEKYQEEIRIIKHDLNNQLIRITAYDDYRAKKEIELMIGSLVKKDETHFTRNVGINSLLGVKYNAALKKGIQCGFSIIIPEKTGIDDGDLARIVGNIVDNAIEGAEKCQQNKWLKLDMAYYNHMLAIRCENSTDGVVNDFTTTKKNSHEHGVGLKSIQNIVNSYHGAFEITVQEDSLMLEVNLWSHI